MILDSNAAGLKGSDFITIVLWDPETPYLKDPAALHANVPTVVLQHLKSLKELQVRIKENPHLLEMSLADAALYHMSMKVKEASTKPVPATVFRWLTAMDGAMSKIGKYALNFNGRIKMKESAVWTAALKSWDHLSKQTQPTCLPAATAQDIKKAMDLQVDQQIRFFILLLWLMAARKGDVAHVQTKNVDLRPDGRLTVFMQEGKGVHARQGMYHIPTNCPPEWQESLKSFLNKHKADKYLFRKSLATSAEVLQAIRLVNENLSIRAVRRGAAQAMAKDTSVSEETIMKITGHKRVETLHRYLNWDKTNEKSHKAAQEAARKNLSF